MLEELRTRGLGGAEEGASCWRGGKKDIQAWEEEIRMLLHSLCFSRVSDIVVLKSQKLMGGKRLIC